MRMIDVPKTLKNHFAIWITVHYLCTLRLYAQRYMASKHHKQFLDWMIWKTSWLDGWLGILLPTWYVALAKTLPESDKCRLHHSLETRNTSAESGLYLWLDKKKFCNHQISNSYIQLTFSICYMCSSINIRNKSLSQQNCIPHGLIVNLSHNKWN